MLTRRAQGHARLPGRAGDHRHPGCPGRASLATSRHPLAYGECWMPKAEGPEKDRDGILGPAMERYYGKRSRWQMGGSGVDEDTNQNIYDNKKSRFAKEGLEKIHASLPLPLEVETIYLAISNDPTTSGDGSISPNGQGFTSLLQQSSSYAAACHVDTP